MDAEGVVWVSVKEPAYRGRANGAMMALLSVTLGVRTSALIITEGRNDCTKTIQVWVLWSETKHWVQIS